MPAGYSPPEYSPSYSTEDILGCQIFYPPGRDQRIGILIFIILGASCRCAAGPGFPLVSFCLRQKGYRFNPLRVLVRNVPRR
jgi:hypothetical protein